MAFDQSSAGRTLKLNVKRMLKDFEKEQKIEVEKILSEIGQEEAKNMRSRLQRIRADGTPRVGGIGAKVASTVASRMHEANGDYKQLEIGSIKGRAIGSRGADLAVILAEGKAEGSPIKDPPGERPSWFFGNSPNTGKTFNFPVKAPKPGYISPAKDPEPEFIEKGMENIERKVRERVMEGIEQGWSNTARNIERKSGFKDFQQYISKIRTR